MFQAITWRIGQLTKTLDSIHLVELTPGDRPEGPRASAAGSRTVHAIKEIFRAPLPERFYHGEYYIAYRYSQESLLVAPITGAFTARECRGSSGPQILCWRRDWDSSPWEEPETKGDLQVKKGARRTIVRAPEH